MLALWAGILLYRRTRALESFLSSASPVPVVADLSSEDNPYFLLITSPHVCAVDAQTWSNLIALTGEHRVPLYGWILAQPDLPETSRWLASMHFPFPLRVSSPSRALLPIEGILGENPWIHLPALLLVYRGRVVVAQSLATLDLQGMLWLYGYLKNRERWPWFF